MKKYLIILTLYIGLLLILGYKIYQDEMQIRKVNAMYERREYLLNEGYSIEASKHITDVEFSVISADYEYQALMED